MPYAAFDDASRVPSVLAEPSLFYDPPYERPVEDEFAWHLVKYLDPAVALAYQVKSDTPCAPVWIDFIIEQGARRVGIEVEDLPRGTRGLSTEPFAASLRRDALVLGSGRLDVLYRVRAEDVLAHLHDVLLLMARIDPALFSERGRINLHTLASVEARNLPLRPEAGLLRIVRPAREDESEVEGERFGWPERPAGEVVVRRLSADRPAPWHRAYEEALAEFGIDLDEGTRGWARSA